MKKIHLEDTPVNVFKDCEPDEEESFLIVLSFILEGLESEIKLTFENKKDRDKCFSKIDKEQISRIIEYVKDNL